jgi:predicted metalloprotease with PDZ domain
VAALLAVFLAIYYLAFSPVDVEKVSLPKYEAAYGFRGGRIYLRYASGEPTDAYALVHVDPDGPLGRAGFRSGDIPVAHHGGVEEFDWALGHAEAGEAAPVTVIQASEWSSPNGQFRRLTVPARHGKAGPAQ